MILPICAKEIWFKRRGDWQPRSHPCRQCPLGQALPADPDSGFLLLLHSVPRRKHCHGPREQTCPTSPEGPATCPALGNRDEAWCPPWRRSQHGRVSPPPARLRGRARKWEGIPTVPSASGGPPPPPTTEQETREETSPHDSLCSRCSKADAGCLWRTFVHGHGESGERPSGLHPRPAGGTGRPGDSCAPGPTSDTVLYWAPPSWAQGPRTYPLLLCNRPQELLRVFHTLRGERTVASPSDLCPPFANPFVHVMRICLTRRGGKLCSLAWRGGGGSGMLRVISAGIPPGMRIPLPLTEGARPPSQRHRATLTPARETRMFYFF